MTDDANNDKQQAAAEDRLDGKLDIIDASPITEMLAEENRIADNDSPAGPTNIHDAGHS